MTVDSDTGVVQWTPGEAAIGDNPVTVRVEDQGGLSDLQSFTIGVNSSNHAPTAGNDSYEVNEDAVLVVDLPGVLDNDDDSDILHPAAPSHILCRAPCRRLPTNSEWAL